MIETPSTEELEAATRASDAQWNLAEARLHAAKASIVETLAGFLVAMQVAAVIATGFGLIELGRAVF